MFGLFKNHSLNYLILVKKENNNNNNAVLESHFNAKNTVVP